jgi:hypothetical protein
MSQTQAEIIKDGAVTTGDFATNSVSTPKIQNGAVTGEKLADSVKPHPFTTRGFNISI